MNGSKKYKAFILLFIYFSTSSFYLETCYGSQACIGTTSNESKFSFTTQPIVKPKIRSNIKPYSIYNTNLKIPIGVRTRLSARTYADYSYYLRKFPYPYNSMLAITSDIDDSTPEEFANYHQFLNTKEMTPYGRGLGLDIGDSMWMFMGNNHPNKSDYQGDPISHVLTYFSGIDDTKKHYANLISFYYKVGWIDSMHTFGDFSTVSKGPSPGNRKLAIKAWKAINKGGFKFSVWINHGSSKNQQNFGGSYEKDMAYQEGDNPRSKYYNSDLALKNGIKFVWNSVCQSQFGYYCPIFKLKLRDGKKVWGFYRYTHDYIKHKVSWTWNPKNIYKQITASRLNDLVKKSQYSIIAQHFGGYNVKRPFNSKSVKALRLLRSYQDKGKILVARTSRLLNYCLTQKYVKFNRVRMNGVTWFNIQSINDPIFGVKKPDFDDLRGLTFYTKYPNETHILIDMSPLNDSMLQRNPADSTGIPSVSIKWFKSNCTDYTKQAQKYYLLDKSIFISDTNNSLMAKKRKTMPGQNKKQTSPMPVNQQEQFPATVDKKYPNPFQRVNLEDTF